MIKTMVKKSESRSYRTILKNIVKQDYKDYNLNIKFLKQGLKNENEK